MQTKNGIMVNFEDEYKRLNIILCLRYSIYLELIILIYAISLTVVN